MTLLADAGTSFQHAANGSLLLAVPVALVAGLVSFLSPCVLPLVPGYLSYVAGLTGRDLEQSVAQPAPAEPAAGGTSSASAEGTITIEGPVRAPANRGRLRGRVLLGAVLFVLGFTAVFVSYGVLFGTLGDGLRRHQRGIEQVLGLLTVVLGLTFAGVFSRFSLANRQ